LQPEDYKTGDSYGEWLGEFPNTEFPDGSKFYDYLNRWLFQGYQDANGEWHGMRELIAAPGVTTVFATEKLGKAYRLDLIKNKITNIFRRWTGVPVSPHDLRHLYRTYIDDPAIGATPEEKESAAYWMRHSSEMAKKIYSHLECEKKLRLGAQMSERLNQQLLKN
jgi:integrase